MLGELLSLDEQASYLRFSRLHLGGAAQPGVGLLQPTLQLFDGAGDGQQLRVGPLDIRIRRADILRSGRVPVQRKIGDRSVGFRDVLAGNVGTAIDRIDESGAHATFDTSAGRRETSRNSKVFPSVHALVRWETPTSPRSFSLVGHSGSAADPVHDGVCDESRRAWPGCSLPPFYGKPGAIVMSNDTTRWRPDPSGVHELRFFSSDGKPTRLVMDGGRTSYDQTSSSASAPPAAASASMGSELPPSLRTPPSRPAPPPQSEPEALERATPSDDDRPQSVVDVPLGNTEREDSPWRGPRRIAYGIVLVVLALSALGLILVQLNHRREPGRAQALASTTTTRRRPSQRPRRWRYRRH